MARNHKHYCTDWDYLLIGLGAPEMACCTCVDGLERRQATSTYDDETHAYYIELDGCSLPARGFNRPRFVSIAPRAGVAFLPSNTIVEK
jgi:hypothetical protein